MSEFTRQLSRRARLINQKIREEQRKEQARNGNLSSEHSRFQPGHTRLGPKPKQG